VTTWNGWSADDWVRHYASGRSASSAGLMDGALLSSVEAKAQKLVHQAEQFAHEASEMPGKFVHEHEKALKIGGLVALGVVVLMAVKR